MISNDNCFLCEYMRVLEFIDPNLSSMSSYLCIISASISWFVKIDGGFSICPSMLMAFVMVCFNL
jgi:hypothetical protein